MPPAAIVLFSPPGLETARRIKACLGAAEIWGLAGRTSDTDHSFAGAAETLRRLYGEGATIIGLCAAGILVRALAPALSDKRGEPPVVAVSDDGGHVVPLLGGLTGANELARRLAEALGGQAAITASGSRRYGLQLEAPPAGYTLANPGDAKAVTAALLGGATARLEGPSPWLEASGLPLAEDGTVLLRTTPYAEPVPDGGLLYHPRSVSLWVGDAVGPDAAMVETLLRDAGLAPAALGALCVPEGSDPPASLRETARTLGVELRLAGETESVGQLLETGIPGADFVVASTPDPLSTLGRPLGHLAVVGIGPGGPGYLTAEARETLAAADDLVGYETYLAMVPARPDQRRHVSGNRVELDRARTGLGLAAEGRRVAIVSSGDPGIFAMAAAVMEVLDREAAAYPGVEVSVVPGISAMQAAAARLGAPLGHDFCVISLSDIRKPWQVIEDRLTRAAEGDFVIALYNPASRSRRDQIGRAKQLLLTVRPPETPVVVGRNLGREGEDVRVVPLRKLDPDSIDMRTVLIVGSTRTRTFAGPGGGMLAYSLRSHEQA